MTFVESTHRSTVGGSGSTSSPPANWAMSTSCTTCLPWGGAGAKSSLWRCQTRSVGSGRPMAQVHSRVHWSNSGNNSQHCRHPPLQEDTPELQGAHYSRFSALAVLVVFSLPVRIKPPICSRPPASRTWNRLVEWHQLTYSIKPSEP